MSQMARRSVASDRQQTRLFVVVVIVGFGLNLMSSLTSTAIPFTVPRFLSGAGVTLLYLLLGAYNSQVISRLPRRWALLLFFSMQLSLILGIGWLSDTSGTWLMALPMVGWAVEALPGPGRWPLYAAIILVVIVPIGLFHVTDWLATIPTILGVSAAIFFVDVFARLRLSEQTARRRAERLGAKLEEANQQLRDYAAQVKDLATTQERNRLARELHDSVTQSLYSLTLLAAGWRRLAVKGQLDSVEEPFSEIEEVAQQALKEMRLLIFQLRPPALEKEGLQGALHHRLNAVEKRAGVAVRLVTDEVLDVPPEVEEALYAVAVEALNNALKHAAASRVTVQLHDEDGLIRMEVSDNGRGFDPRRMEESRGLGLRSMRERVEELDGKLEVNSKPGAGVCLRAEVRYER